MTDSLRLLARKGTIFQPDNVAGARPLRQLFMPRAYPHSDIFDGTVVGFNIKKRSNEPSYFVYFRSRTGKRLERDTNQTAVGKAIEAAKAIIRKEYEQAFASPRKTTWDEAKTLMKERAETDGLRDTSIGYYQKLIRLMNRDFPSVAGPADISSDMAEAWRKEFSRKPTRRKLPPSPHTVFYTIRGLRTMWEKWFVRTLGICPQNPWADIEEPKADKIEVKTISDEQFAEFLAWIDDRFSGWTLPRLILTTKAVTGCRLADICGVRSDQLQSGKLIFHAAQTKGRKERKVPLPEKLFKQLQAIQGPVFLWENYPAGLKESLTKCGFPTHQLRPEFSPRRLYHWIETLFIDYASANPDKPRITSHMLRKRAFTAAWEAGIDARKAAIAIGCNPDTMMKHYVKMDEEAVTNEVMDALAEKLAPRQMPSR